MTFGKRQLGKFAYVPCVVQRKYFALTLLRAQITLQIFRNLVSSSNFNVYQLSVKDVKSLKVRTDISVVHPIRSDSDTRLHLCSRWN